MMICQIHVDIDLILLTFSDFLHQHYHTCLVIYVEKHVWLNPLSLDGFLQFTEVLGERFLGCHLRPCMFETLVLQPLTEATS